MCFCTVDVTPLVMFVDHFLGVNIHLLDPWDDPAGTKFGWIWRLHYPWRILMVLQYMVCHGSHILPSIYPSHVSIYTSTMDPSWDMIVFFLRSVGIFWNNVANPMCWKKFPFLALEVIDRYILDILVCSYIKDGYIILFLIYGISKLAIVYGSYSRKMYYIL
jgi:hypothetical protein